MGALNNKNWIAFAQTTLRLAEHRDFFDYLLLGERAAAGSADE